MPWCSAPRGSVVYQVEQRGEALTVNRVPVTVLFGDNRQVAVSGALKLGDRVVVRGAGSLQDGDKVGAVSVAEPGMTPIKAAPAGAVFVDVQASDYSTIITLQVLVLPTVSILSPWVSSTMSPLWTRPLALSTSSASRHTSYTGSSRPRRTVPG